MKEKNKTLFVTRNPQRVAFTMEPLSGVSRSLVLWARMLYLYQTMIGMIIFAVLVPKQGLEGEKDLAIRQGGFNTMQACNFYAKKLCIIFLNLAPRHVESGFVSSDTRMS